MTATVAADATSLVSPYYLHPSDNTGQVLTPILLNGSNYERWAKLMLNSLRAKRKIGFVDGTLKRPSDNSDEAEKWDMVNSMIIGWIYSSIESKLRPSISLVDSAKAMWGSLQRRFSVSDDTRIHQLHAEIAACKQNGDSVEVYFGRIKILWDDLADLDKGFQCCCKSADCASMLKYEKSREKIHVHQFLMGLDTTRFGTARSNLLSRQMDLNLETVYSQVIQEERHLSVMRSNEEKIPVVGLSGMTVHPQAAAARFTKPQVTCTHCGKTGHDSTSCFQVIGFPEWWSDKSKPTGGRGNGRGRGVDQNRGRGGRGSGFRAHNVLVGESSGGGESQTSGIPNFTQDQWASLANLLNNQKQSASEKLSGKLYLFGPNSRYDIIIDSGASHHMTGDVNLLTDLVSIGPCPITLPNGKHTWANRCGKLNLGGRFILSRVLYAPHLSITLISVGQLLKDIAGFVLFTRKFCVVQDFNSRTLIGAGKEQDGVYHYKGVVAAHSGRARCLTTRELWHRRLGHPSSAVLSVLSHVGSFSRNSEDSEKVCNVCVRSKQTRNKFPDSINKADDSFDLIHCDLWGPYREQSLSGARYFLTIVDDHSRAVWTFLLLEKKEAPTALKTFISFVERQFHKRVRMIRSDNGSEFICLKQFFADHGISHQTSCVETPQQNGRVERKHRHILNVARALLFQASLPIRFWGESVLAATYLINRTPSKILANKTPYEILFRKPPSFDHLRTFGTLCYAKRISRGSDKFQERSVRCLFIGYPVGKKAWLMYDLKEEKTFASRDVVFHENIFPFALKKQTDSTDPEPHSELHLAIFDEEDSLGEASTGGAQELTPEPAATESDALPVEETASSNSDSVPPTEDLGRGKRSKTQSVLLQPYKVYAALAGEAPDQDHVPKSSETTLSGACTYPLTDYVSGHRLSPAQQAYSAAITSETEPRSFKEAFKKRVWREAVKGEVGALEDTNTWTVMTLPAGKHAIGCQWVFKIKFNAYGTIERYKARLVVLGNRQQEGIDYKETFAPVVKMTTIRILLGVAAAKGWELYQMDVHNAFLHGDLEEEIYMQLPPGFKSTVPNQVCKLNKSLYGLRQAPRCWFSKLSTALTGFGFQQNKADYSLFTLVQGSSIIYVLVYVDDLIIGGNDSVLISRFKDHLHRCFHMKDLGVLKYFLGIEVARANEGIYLSQRKYALDIVSECGLLGAKPADTPIEQNHNLARADGPYFSDPAKYRRLVGRLVYLAVTRPELSYGVHILAQFLQSPRQKHWDAATRLVRYLKGSPGQGILLSSRNDLKLSVYCDSDWAACPLTRRSLSGYIVMLGNSLISWKTKKQKTVSRSSAEAEYRSMALAFCELIWTKAVLESLGVAQSSPMSLFCDNKAALHIAANPVFHERTKHIEADCHFVRDGVQDGTIVTQHVKTTEQLADLLTKALGSRQFRYLLCKMGVQDLHAPS